MAKVNTVSRGRTNIKIGRSESAIVFSTTGVHNALSEDSRQFIDDMLTKGESEAFKGITPEKFWTVVLPAVTYVKMAQYIKEVQQSNNPEAEGQEHWRTKQPLLDCVAPAGRTQRQSRSR